MKKVYHMITCVNYLLAICLVKGMVLKDGTEHLDYLLQKSFYYERLKNYEENLKTVLIPKGLRVKDSAAIPPVTEEKSCRIVTVRVKPSRRKNPN